MWALDGLCGHTRQDRRDGDKHGYASRSAARPAILKRPARLGPMSDRRLAEVGSGAECILACTRANRDPADVEMKVSRGRPRFAIQGNVAVNCRSDVLKPPASPVY